MADFRAEMHRRKHGEQQGPRLAPKPPQAPRIPRMPPESKPKRRVQRWRARESWPVFRRRLVESVSERLAELADRSAAEWMPCPWGAVFGGECLDPCRCNGARRVTVGFMRAHYQLVLTLYSEESHAGKVRG